MYRLGRLHGKNGGIITHADGDTSRVEVDNKVFINANTASEHVTATSSLAQRNNDYMQFSWDPMNVVNISRQQKAICKREQTKLLNLERFFSRQRHEEQYKQKSLIDKFRQRLVRLNRLRMSGELVKATEASVLPISRCYASYRRIGNVSSSSDHGVSRQQTETNKYLNYVTPIVNSDKKLTVRDNGDYLQGRGCLNTGYSPVSNNGVRQSDDTTVLPDIYKQAGLRVATNTRPLVGYRSQRSYLLDKSQSRSNKTAECDENKVGNNNWASDKLNLHVADSHGSKRAQNGVGCVKYRLGNSARNVKSKQVVKFDPNC